MNVQNGRNQIHPSTHNSNWQLAIHDRSPKMRTLRTAILFLAVSPLAACGTEIVDRADELTVKPPNPATNSACSLPTVALRLAGNFAVLAGSTVTNTGPTTVNGDLGVSPGSAVTGFPPGVLVGTRHAADPAASLAIGDLLTAYNDAAGRTLCPIKVAGNLGGKTLFPGLYKSTSSLEVSSGDLTLDAQGTATRSSSSKWYPR